MDKLTTFTDSRGSLTLATVGKEIFFVPQRAYWVHHVPAGQTRGMHANRVVDEFVVCVSGAVSIEVQRPGEAGVTVRLSHPDQGLAIPAMAWSRQYDFTPNAVLLVLASGDYDRATYIDSYAEWLEACAQ